MKKQIAVHSKNPTEDISIINDLKSLFTQEYEDIDFHIFGDMNEVPNIDYAIMSSYYMYHYPGIIVFLDTDDLLEYKDNTIGSLYFYVDNNNLITNQHYSQLLKEYTGVIYNENNKMEIVSNEIRQSIRQ